MGSTRTGLGSAAFAALLTLTAACAPSPAPPVAASRPSASAGETRPAQPTAKSIVDAPDRSEADRALDPGRRPAELLVFLDLQPGMRVAEIAAGGGYTTELLARSVGPTGEVYGVNSAFVLDRFAQAPWSARLQKPVMANVRRLDREFDDSFPDGLGSLDLVVNVLFYHDTYWMELDRAAMNRAIFEALRPGGRYVIVDHSAADPDGDADVQRLHRVGESLVQQEVLDAGFELGRSADFLRNPDDTREWNAAPSAAGERRGTSDRFVVEFVKPSEG